MQNLSQVPNFQTYIYADTRPLDVYCSHRLFLLFNGHRRQMPSNIFCWHLISPAVRMFVQQFVQADFFANKD